jgi:DNA-binding FadR family transcriptional regulator
MAMKPISISKRYRLVIEAIQNYIIDHGLQPGDRLPTENELAIALQVGRSSIREAVKSLEVLGVIETRVGEGMFVRSFNCDSILDNLPYSMLFDRDDLEEILDIRIALELYHIDKAVMNMSEENLNSIKNVLKEMNKAVKEQNKHKFVEADKKFHSLLYAPINNNLLIKLITIFWDLLANAEDFNKISEPNIDLSYKRHLNIYKAIESKKCYLLTELLTEHFEITRRRINV